MKWNGILCATLCILGLTLFGYSSAGAESLSGKIRGAALDEKLGDKIPMNLTFTDSNGKVVSLEEVADGKPLIIDMGYFECPDLCDVVLEGLMNVLDKVSEVPGKDFNVATISFSTSDTPEIAADKKDQFYGQMTRAIPASAWRFMTGDSANIYTLTDALGFYFKKEKGGDFMHPTALIVVDRTGKIIRYIEGTSYAPVDLNMAIMEAQAGTPEEIISALLCVCFSHTPAGDHLVFNVLGVVGIGTLVFVAGLVMFLRSTKKFVKNKSEEAT